MAQIPIFFFLKLDQEHVEIIKTFFFFLSTPYLPEKNDLIAL